MLENGPTAWTSFLQTDEPTLYVWLSQPYLSHDVSVSVAGGEMQWSVISAVHYVDASASHDEHVNNAAPPFPACPVQGAEAVVVTKTQDAQRERQAKADKSKN